MKIKYTGHTLALRMTDEQAAALILALEASLARRKELGQKCPDVLNWSDIVVSTAGELNNAPAGISISICAV